MTTQTHPLLVCTWMTWRSCSKLLWPESSKRERVSTELGIFSLFLWFRVNWFECSLTGDYIWYKTSVLTVKPGSFTWFPGLTRRRAASAHKCAALITSALRPVNGASWGASIQEQIGLDVTSGLKCFHTSGLEPWVFCQKPRIFSVKMLVVILGKYNICVYYIKLPKLLN